MGLESISSVNSSKVYADVVKQNVSKTPQAKTAEDTAKNVPVTPAVQVSTESKTSPVEGKDEENASRKMKDAIDKVNKKIVPNKTRCEFSYHEETKRVSIKVIDQNTDEVIKEIPPEETLDMLSKVWELAGLLVDERR